MDIATFKNTLIEMLGNLDHEISTHTVADAIEEACGVHKWLDMGNPTKMWVQLVDTDDKPF